MKSRTQRATVAMLVALAGCGDDDTGALSGPSGLDAAPAPARSDDAGTDATPTPGPTAAPVDGAESAEVSPAGDGGPPVPPPRTSAATLDNLGVDPAKVLTDLTGEELLRLCSASVDVGERMLPNYCKGWALGITAGPRFGEESISSCETAYQGCLKVGVHESCDIPDLACNFTVAEWRTCFREAGEIARKTLEAYPSCQQADSNSLLNTPDLGQVPSCQTIVQKCPQLGRPLHPAYLLPGFHSPHPKPLTADSARPGSTGIDPNRKLLEASVAELQKLCQAGVNTRASLYDKSCKAESVHRSRAYAAHRARNGDPFPSDAEFIASCQRDIARECGEHYTQGQTCRLSKSRCNATVGQWETCISEAERALDAALATFPGCEVGLNQSLPALPKPEAIPACAALSDCALDYPLSPPSIETFER